MIKKNLSQEELAQIKNRLAELYDQEKKLEKLKRGKLWLWFLLPFIGLLIYYFMIQKRNSDPVFQIPLRKAKEEIATLELQLLFYKSNQEKMEE
ncbi:hypothetical protein SSABA_v1c04990 [Spiroplasma sabaudiense Ar-1343]|uniref:Uncharacterized protein n=1 Tax=Spiroplasma sabaudiense Ar-1343 TaxID=1276257 RepID=W6AA68_9MOLU|nr:hypothetical protein [Spiroplasma sabaudiense]AHI53906.1 hypothetical protein SSABA_v1c04990 [Spiroplasma sabaudiense Ar-1343]